MKFQRIIIFSIFAAISIVQAQSVWADESGTFRAITIHVLDYTTINKSDYLFTGGPLSGASVVIESSGGPFVVGEMENIRCILYAIGPPTDLEIEAP